MNSFRYVWSKLAQFHNLVKKLELYNYPSIFTLLERDTSRWFDEFGLVQTLYVSHWEGVIPSSEIEKFKGLDIRKLSLELKIPKIFFPNISNFKVILGPLCWIFAMFGISKRKNNLLLFRNYKNGSVNRKLFYYFYMLHKYKTHKEYKKYWKLCEVILEDKDYMLGVFNKTHPTWYKSMSLKQVTSILKQVENIVNSSTKDLYISYKRVNNFY